MHARAENTHVEDTRVIYLEPKKLLVCQFDYKIEVAGGNPVTGLEFVSGDKKNEFVGYQAIDYEQSKLSHLDKNSIIHLIEKSKHDDVDELRHLLNSYLELSKSNCFDLYCVASDPEYPVDLRAIFHNVDEANAAKNKIFELSVSNNTKLEGVQFVCDIRNFYTQTAIIIKSIDKNQLKNFINTLNTANKQLCKTPTPKELEDTIDLLKKHFPFPDEVKHSFHINVDSKRIQSASFKKDLITPAQIDKVNNHGVYFTYKGKTETKLVTFQNHEYERLLGGNISEYVLIVELYDFMYFKKSLLNLRENEEKSTGQLFKKIKTHGQAISSIDDPVITTGLSNHSTWVVPESSKITVKTAEMTYSQTLASVYSILNINDNQIDGLLEVHHPEAFFSIEKIDSQTKNEAFVMYSSSKNILNLSHLGKQSTVKYIQYFVYKNNEHTNLLKVCFDDGQKKIYSFLMKSDRYRCYSLIRNPSEKFIFKQISSSDANNILKEEAIRLYQTFHVLDGGERLGLVYIDSKHEWLLTAQSIVYDKKLKKWIGFGDPETTMEGSYINSYNMEYNLKPQMLYLGTKGWCFYDNEKRDNNDIIKNTNEKVDENINSLISALINLGLNKSNIVYPIHGQVSTNARYYSSYEMPSAKNGFNHVNVRSATSITQPNSRQAYIPPIAGESTLFYQKSTNESASISSMKLDNQQLKEFFQTICSDSNAWRIINNNQIASLPTPPTEAKEKFKKIMDKLASINIKLPEENDFIFLTDSISQKGKKTIVVNTTKFISSLEAKMLNEFKKLIIETMKVKSESQALTIRIADKF